MPPLWVRTCYATANKRSLTSLVWSKDLFNNSTNLTRALTAGFILMHLFNTNNIQFYFYSNNLHRDLRGRHSKYINVKKMQFLFLCLQFLLECDYYFRAYIIIFWRKSPVSGHCKINTGKSSSCFCHFLFTCYQLLLYNVSDRINFQII